MKIFVNISGEKDVSHSYEEVKEMRAQGKIQNDTLVWVEGTPDWIPYGELSVPGMPELPKAKASICSIIALVLAGLGIPVWFILFLSAGIASSMGKGEESPVMIAIGLFIMLMFGVNILAGILGFVGVFLSKTKRWLGILAVVLNISEILFVGSLIILGIAKKGGM